VRKSEAFLLDEKEELLDMVADLKLELTDRIAQVDSLQRRLDQVSAKNETCSVSSDHRSTNSSKTRQKLKQSKRLRQYLKNCVHRSDTDDSASADRRKLKHYATEEC
jgi:hypothetical protein